MNIKILYDNQAKKGFQCGWGFSVLIDDATLFDTGESADALLLNMRAFNAKPESIKRVVLSHEDLDHVGGIAILKQCGPVNVYLPISFSRRIKEDIKSLNRQAELVEVGKNTEIDSDMVVLGQLGYRKKEISLATRTSKGLVVLTGCAHPGLDRIMKQASQFGDIYAVIGGFHGFSKLKALADVPVIVPTHCTQKKQEILDMYPKQARPACAGDEFEL